MLWFKNSLDKEIDNLSNTYQKEIDRWKNAYEQLVAQIESNKNKDITTSTFSADFARMNAFAIERNVSSSTREVCTIIGYILKEPVVFTDGNVSEKDVVREWYLYCSQEQHEKLVKEFNEYRSTYVKADQ